MFSRKEQLEICQTCQRKLFDKQKGMLCGLTNEFAAFESVCPDYLLNPIAAKRAERVENQKDNLPSIDEGSRGMFGTEKKLLNSGIGGGILMIVGGTVWIILGLMADHIFFYPIFLIIGGIIVLVKGLAQRAKQMAKPDTSGILDDQDDLEVI